MARNLMGWKRQPFDPRDFVFHPPRRIVRALPATVDLSAGMGGQLNQDQLGSCGPFTATELIMYDQKAEGLLVVEVSELFVYYNTRKIMGTTSEDSGVDNRSMMQALSQYGFCPGSLWPYVESKFTQQPPTAAYQSALANRITQYAAVTQSASEMQGTLASGRPFCFGFDVFNGMMADAVARTGIVPDPSGSVIGGHDISFVGFNSTGKPLPGVKAGNVWPNGYYKFRNHWVNDDGTPWGDGGYGYISYAYAHGPHASDFWVITTIPGGVVPTPTPTPTPSPPPPAPTPTPGPIPVNPNYAGYVQTPFGKWKIALAPVATGDEQGAVATLTLDPKALSLSGVWAFILKYWGLIEPYLAEYEPLIVMTIEKDLLSGVTDPVQIFKDLVTALLGVGADVSRLAQPGA